MNELIEVRIDTERIPEDVGHIKPFGSNNSLYIKSMGAFRTWVLNQIPDHTNVLFVVSGPMPNCAALQIGVLLGNKGKVVFETTRNYVREMVV